MNQERTENKQPDIFKTKLYTLTECESILGLSHRSLLRWVTEGKIKAVKIGGRWKVSEDTLRDILEATNV